MNAVELQIFRQLWTKQQARAVREFFHEDQRTGMYRHETMPDEIWNIVTRLSHRHTAKLGVRTPDLLHIATALFFKPDTFYSFDQRQRRFAQVEKLHTLPHLNSETHVNNFNNKPITKNQYNEWLGIDFSGNHEEWGKNRKNSNIYIARVREENGKYRLTDLRSVQNIPDPADEPFQKLTNLLKQGDFIAAGIDAPFSIPGEYLYKQNHQALLASNQELLAKTTKIKTPKRPFPTGEDFIRNIFNGNSPTQKKPLRSCEEYWQKQRVNVRSTLWNQRRGGAPMTAACLTLLHQSQAQIWPWAGHDKPGILVEAFPAAQLCCWGLNCQGYNGKEEANQRARKVILDKLADWIEIPNKFNIKMQTSADALDAVICAFAAIAVSKNQLQEDAMQAKKIQLAEGQIAVHAPIGSAGN